MSVTRGTVFIGVAVTPLHPGAGRSPGIVDLPVQRDSLGYPLVYASSVKGALKNLCVKRQCRDKIDVDRGRVKCDECKVCCCLFGGEPGEGDKGAGALAFLDLIPLAFPAPSAEQGYVYVTTPVLLARALLTLEAVGEDGLPRLRENLGKLLEEAERLGSGQVLASPSLASKGGSITIGATPLSVIDVLGEKDVLDSLREATQGLGGLASRLADRLVVTSAEDGVAMVERSLIRVTRVRLNRARKTVASGALWTEEYIPYGTVFLTAVVDTGYRNDFCEGDVKPIEKLEEILGGGRSDNNVFYVFVGGKETIGRGLIKFQEIGGGAR